MIRDAANKRRLLLTVWVATVAVVLIAVGLIGPRAFFSGLEMPMMAALLVTIALYFDDRLRGKSAFIGTVIVRPGARDFASRCVDGLALFLGLFAAGFLIFRSVGAD